MKLCSIVKTSR